MLPSGLPEIIAGSEPLAAFLVSSSSHYNSTMVKYGAFLPNSHDGEKSVCRHGAEPKDELQRLGTVYRPDCTVHGAGVVGSEVVKSLGLTIDPQEPPERHANIRGWAWSESDPKMGKAENMVRAKLLAEKATLVRW